MTECKFTVYNVSFSSYPTIDVFSEFTAPIVGIIADYLYKTLPCDRKSGEQKRNVRDDHDLTILLHIEHPGVLSRLHRLYMRTIKPWMPPLSSLRLPTSGDGQLQFYRRAFHITSLLTINQGGSWMEGSANCLECGKITPVQELTIPHLEKTLKRGNNLVYFHLCQSCMDYPKILLKRWAAKMCQHCEILITLCKATQRLPLCYWCNVEWAEQRRG